MKKNNLRFFSLIIIFVFIGVQFVSAQKNKDTNASNPEKEVAFLIDRTSNFMHTTFNAVKKNKVYTGYLKKAADNQKEAINFFGQKNYEQAAKSSYKARRYSFLAYGANKQNVPQGWKLNQRENVVFKTLIKQDFTDEELKAAVVEADVTSEKSLELKKEDFPKVGKEEVEGEDDGDDDGEDDGEKAKKEKEKAEKEKAEKGKKEKELKKAKKAKKEKDEKESKGGKVNG